MASSEAKHRGRLQTCCFDLHAAKINAESKKSPRFFLSTGSRARIIGGILQDDCSSIAHARRRGHGRGCSPDEDDQATKDWQAPYAMRGETKHAVTDEAPICTDS